MSYQNCRHIGSRRICFQDERNEALIMHAARSFWSKTTFDQCWSQVAFCAEILALYSFWMKEEAPYALCIAILSSVDNVRVLSTLHCCKWMCCIEQRGHETFPMQLKEWSSPESGDLRTWTPNRTCFVDRGAQTQHHRESCWFSNSKEFVDKKLSVWDGTLCTCPPATKTKAIRNTCACFRWWRACLVCWKNVLLHIIAL